ncbi:Peptidyl-tRNA hydrolase, PTH2 domain protein [mine drainage metagenome]|uniref:peptidyl-tRNA hydrolase n=1 Tax=mine drainage metagenome TaxID=410659 RepID=T1CF68_9ZZZZ
MVDEYKLVVIIRKDLDIGKGKMAAQVAHAAVNLALHAEKKARRFSGYGKHLVTKKVVVRVSGVEELFQLKHKAEIKGLSTSIIMDAGLTQIPPGTITCLGIGPAESSEIDEITGNLPLW